jgi:hypothetical protein
MLSSHEDSIYASNEGVPSPVRMDSLTRVKFLYKDSETNAIDRRITELERNLVAKTKIIHNAKIIFKLGNSSLVGKVKQEKVSYLKAREAKQLIAATHEEIFALTIELLKYMVSFSLS